MKTIIHKSFCNISFCNSCHLFKIPAFQNHFMSNKSIFSRIKNISNYPKTGSQVIGIENCYFSCPCQSFPTKHFYIGMRNGQYTGTSVGSCRNCRNAFYSAGFHQGMCGKKFHQVMCHTNRTNTGTPPPWGIAKVLCRLR